MRDEKRPFLNGRSQNKRRRDLLIFWKFIFLPPSSYIAYSHTAKIIKAVNSYAIHRAKVIICFIGEKHSPGKHRTRDWTACEVTFLKANLIKTLQLSTRHRVRVKSICFKGRSLISMLTVNDLPISHLSFSKIVSWQYSYTLVIL